MFDNYKIYLGDKITIKILGKNCTFQFRIWPIDGAEYRICLNEDLKAQKYISKIEQASFSKYSV